MKPKGLKPTKRDPRDYHYQKTFGSVDVVLPDEYFAGRPKILNQRASMFCTAFATCVAAACQDSKDFSPEWFFAKEKEISGSALNEGEDLRTPMKAAKEYGFLPQEAAPFSLSDHDPVFLADYKNWPDQSDILAKQYVKPSFFRVDGTFQQIRQILWANRQYKRAIVTGVQWYNEWTMAQGGIVPENYNSPAGLHCVCIIGFTKMYSKNYLVLQDSDGEIVGDRGLFYLSETVFNREFAEPMFMLVDTDGQTQPQPIGNALSIWLYKLIRLLCNGKI